MSAAIEPILNNLADDMKVEAAYFVSIVLRHGYSRILQLDQFAARAKISNRKVVRSAVIAILKQIEKREGVRIKDLSNDKRNRYVELMESICQKSVSPANAEVGLKQAQVTTALDALREFWPDRYRDR
jgi:hypothetical protein